MDYNATSIQKIEIYQHNTARSIPIMHTVLELALEATIDFVLIQEPYIASDNRGTVSHPAYIAILPRPRDDIRPRVAIYARKDTAFKYTARPDIIDDSDVLALTVSGDSIAPFELYNVYNEKGLGDSEEYTVKRSLQNINLGRRAIISGDFNAHHSWWNSTVSNPIRCQELIPWLEKYGLELKNTEDIATFYRPNCQNLSIIDLAFATRDLENNRYNLAKADWKQFRSLLIDSYRITENEISNLDLDKEEDLEKLASFLTYSVKTAADKAIPRQKTSLRAKPWWNNDIKKAREQLSHLKRIWKRNRDQESSRNYSNHRNKYFEMIKRAKQNLWDSFLENARGKEVFKAFNYTKYKTVERIPIIKYRQEGSIKQATTFKEKSQAFLSTLFPKPPEKDPLDWHQYRSDPIWEWPKVELDEIKTAIFTSSTKKAPGPDRISFKIVQEAFLAIPDLFYRVYSTLIDRGYHPRQWKEAIGVILKKSGKRDETVPKTYRVISLLNCLGKTAEKIIATRLSYLAETTGLLYPEQIGGRIQKSAIDAALALTHDIELARNRGLKSSALLLDIKGAFDHVSKNQLLGFCQRLKLPISICNWIESFISDRSIRLAFDGESTEKTKIETGIPQGSPVSPILFLIYIRFLFEEIDIDEEELELSIPSYMDDITIRVSTTDLENNCRILQKIADKLVE